MPPVPFNIPVHVTGLSHVCSGSCGRLAHQTDMAGGCERSVIDKGTAGIGACPGREGERCGNLVEAIDATPIQNSFVGRKHISKQCAGAYLNWQSLLKTEDN